MKVPISWFLDYVDIDTDSHSFAAAMTMSGSMVEGVEEQGKNILNVVTGRILEIAPHPDADKLVVCKVDVGNEIVQIVTGATNVFVGAVVPVAKDGATLPNGKIKKGKLRGVESCGMMCSEEELGIAAEAVHGIMILDDNLTLGVDIREVLGLNESIVEFEITSNRPDCLSVIGLAREVSATFDKPIKINAPVVTENSENIKDYASVEVLDFNLCPRYCSRVVKNVKIAQSPEWLQRRLAHCGIRSINNIVDITNYVMLEYGQPMHSFDISNISDSKIIVRRAKDGETITTLDGEKRQLDSDMLVIADSTRPIAIAGVMGGENSEVKEDTTTILFESAVFSGASVRTTAKKVGLRTEASARYEKGLDMHNCEGALSRACELIVQLGAGEVVGGMIDEYEALSQKRRITFSPCNINKFLGTDIDLEFMKHTLESLDFEVEGDFVIVPTYRDDVEGEADIAEEIARIYGYNKIPSTLLKGEATLGGKNEKQKAEDLIRNTLTSLGLYEVMTYSFISPKMYEKLNMEKDDCIVITNPLGEDQSIMRTQTIGSMLEVASTNYNYRNEEALLFEIGTTYHKSEQETLADEKQEITIAMYGKNADYYKLKGAVEQLFEAFGITYFEIEMEKENNVFHPGQTANILLKRKKAATIGTIHPQVQKNFSIGVPVYAAVIDFNILMECKKLSKTYKHLPKYPAVTRDIAMLVKDEVTIRQIEDIFRKAKTNIIEEFKLFDVYKGKQVEEGCKSIAYSLVFRGADRTLTDDEVNPVMEKIISDLSEKLGAKLRIN